MAFASGGTLGTGANSTSNSSYTFNTATNSLAAGNIGILVNVTDNTSTTDGDNNEHTSVTGGTGNWTKLGEYTNSNAAAAAGVTVSLWLFTATGTNGTGTTITLNYASNRTDKTCSFWKFTKASGYDARLDPDAATNPITSAVDASNGFGSSAFSGLPSQARLYFRGAGKEANSTTALTVSANFTTITAQRSRNNASAVLVRGEFRINTSTGETSNPTLAVSGDTAGLFAAIEEYLAERTGTLAATEGSDTASMSGGVLVQGTLAATESGADTFAADGDVIVQGSLTVTETGADTFAASGEVTDNLGVQGDLGATESGADTFAGAGDVLIQGTAAATETGSDTLAATGSVLVRGALAAAEAGADTFAAAGDVIAQGTLAATETGADTFSGSGTVPQPPITGTLAASESGQDTFAGAGTTYPPQEAGGGGGRRIQWADIEDDLTDESAQQAAAVIAQVLAAVVASGALEEMT